ncbi:MAG: hypothetical protein JWO45_1584 [Spartobacteria bacterium]|nr:hypothetical protein [Spartobacteria bacterium]
MNWQAGSAGKSCELFQLPPQLLGDSDTPLAITVPRRMPILLDCQLKTRNDDRSGQQYLSQENDQPHLSFRQATGVRPGLRLRPCFIAGQLHGVLVNLPLGRWHIDWRIKRVAIENQSRRHISVRGGMRASRYCPFVSGTRFRR